MAKKRGLGKGLSALLESAETDITTSSKNVEIPTVGSITNIPINQIEANPFQPRTKFEKEALIELVNSIKQHGVIQPITLRKLGYDKYQIISGERRFRASQIAGFEEIPAYIRVANDQAMLEMAIVENIQRQNLNAIEVALSFKRLIEECNLTQEELSEKVGKSRTAVTNYLRLLKLPEEIQLGLVEKKITMGHARALISIENTDNQISFYQSILDENLSVRDTESKVKQQKSNSVGQKRNKKVSNTLNENITSWQNSFANSLDTKVQIQQNSRGKGKIVIEYKNQSDLDRIMKALDK